MYRYFFKNMDTGLEVTATAPSLNQAARNAGIDVSYGHALPVPWRAVACVKTFDGTIVWRKE